MDNSTKVSTARSSINSCNSDLEDIKSKLSKVTQYSYANFEGTARNNTMTIVNEILAEITGACSTISSQNSDLASLERRYEREEAERRRLARLENIEEVE